MKVLLAGPVLTSALADATGIDLSGLPAATAQTPIAQVAAGLIAAGHNVHVVTLDPTIDVVQSFERQGLQVTFCPLRAPPRYRTRVRMVDLFAAEIRHLASVMRASDADVVHAHWTYEYCEAGLRSGKPLLVTMHDLGWDCLFHFRDLYRAMRLAMKYRAMVRVRDLTVVGHFMRRKAWQYGYFGEVSVIPNPIATADWSIKTLEKPVLVTVGNSTALKNVTAAVAAVAIIRQKWPDTELHLFGPGLDSDWAQARSLPGVIGHGNVEHRDLMAFIANDANVMIHPSRLETFGVAIAEAKIRGVPAIAGAYSGGTVDVIGDVGTLCNIEDPALIASAVTAMLDNEEDYRALQRASHEDIVARFSVADVTSQYTRIYGRILARHDHDKALLKKIEIARWQE